MWTLQNATVALSYTAIVYTRKTDEMEQTFQAMVWNNGEMTLFATETWHGMESGFTLANTPRSYLNSDAEITEAFYKTCFCGVAQ
jgi:hypothetical protein